MTENCWQQPFGSVFDERPTVYYKKKFAKHMWQHKKFAQIMKLGVTHPSLPLICSRNNFLNQPGATAPLTYNACLLSLHAETRALQVETIDSRCTDPSNPYYLEIKEIIENLQFEVPYTSVNFGLDNHLFTTLSHDQNSPGSSFLVGSGFLIFTYASFAIAGERTVLFSIPVKYKTLEVITAQYLPQPMTNQDAIESAAFHKSVLAGYFFARHGDSLGLKDYERKYAVEIMRQLTKDECSFTIGVLAGSLCVNDANGLLDLSITYYNMMTSGGGGGGYLRNANGLCSVIQESDYIQATRILKKSKARSGVNLNSWQCLDKLGW